VTADLIDVQYAACYTQGVETTLRQIHDRSEGSVKWLHYGTTEGAYLNYPGFLWPRSCGGSQCGETYDPRSRPWYAQGATGSKNVVIIFDTSGSMSNVRDHTSPRTEHRRLVCGHRSSAGSFAHEMTVIASWLLCIVAAQRRPRRR
jgi:hypothetical protein